MSDPKEWIAATLLPGVGTTRLAQWHAQGVAVPTLFAGPASVLPLRPDTRAAVVEYQARGPLYQRATQYLEQARAQGWQLLTLDDPAYPPLLREIPDPPLLLWVQGDAAALTLPQLAVVGSRQASRDGLALAARFAQELTLAGLVMTSGLARGIDAAAHRAAVACERPTVAVLGTGLDRLYPRAHQTLAEQIPACGGCLVTEFVPGTGPLKYNFPRRNRIISGLSVGTLVVEAAPRSGSLITARQALEQGREVFAIPGSIHNPYSRGCHALIREGAHLVETSAHILTELGALLGALTAFESAADICLPDAPPEDADPLLVHLPYAPISFDELCASVPEQTPAALQQALMRLELDGLVEWRGGLVQRCR